MALHMSLWLTSLIEIPAWDRVNNDDHLQTGKKEQKKNRENERDSNQIRELMTFVLQRKKLIQFHRENRQLQSNETKENKYKWRILMSMYYKPRIRSLQNDLSSASKSKTEIELWKPRKMGIFSGRKENNRNENVCILK